MSMFSVVAEVLHRRIEVVDVIVDDVCDAMLETHGVTLFAVSARLRIVRKHRPLHLTS